ncbi:MAG: TonB-dependent receptor [Bacteroidales bacterium]|nr:TonB-dependent receptor [Bacteroidales bacterium]
MKSCRSKTICLGRTVALFIAILANGTVAFAQSKTVTGTIVDDLGEPVVGANVVIDGTATGVTTDLDGNFILKEVPEKAVLKISFIGYATQSVPVNGKAKIQVTLKEETSDLDEVVVVGYGVMKKRDLTGSVASIKTGDIQQVAAANALQAMQAKVPGMDLQQSNGQAGAGVSITLRGQRSISATNSPLILVDGVEYGSTLDIPASDIESMDILKDAASTAIYGTKGANGVIIITTKRGKAGKTRVDLNSYWSFNSPTSVVKGMYGKTEAQRFLDRENYKADLASGNWGSSNVSYSDVFASTALDDGTLLTDIIGDGSYTDWYDYILQNSTTQNYELSVAGGNEKTSVKLSLAAMIDNGVLKNDKMNRYNGALNLDHSINKKLSVGGTFNFTYKSNDARNSSVFNSARKMTSITHAYNEDGTINETPNPLYTAHVNPLMDEDGNYVKNTETIRFRGSNYVQLVPIKGLTLKSQFSVDRKNVRTGSYADYESVGRYQSPHTSSISNAQSASTSFNWQNTANYSKTFGKHDFGIMLGHEMNQDVDENLSLSGTAGQEHYYTSTFYDVSKISSDLSYSSGYTKTSLLSFFGRVNYSFANKYLLQASVRGDGSSVLAEGHKWASFPSASVGWRIIEEDWMRDLNEAIRMDNLKLRLSWGVAGNSAISAYQTLATVSATTPSSSTDFIPMSMGNEDLTWEKTYSTDLGLDFGFFNNRLNGSVDLYWTRTTDLLYYRSAPASSVYTSIISNIGESKGNGVEVALNALAVKTKNFTWDINASYTHSADELVKLADGLTQNIDGTDALIVGQPLSIYYDYEVGNCWGVGEYDAYVEEMAAKGITVESPVSGYGTPGTMKIIDRNQDGVIDDNDKRVYNRSPKHILGLTNTFTYRDFSLSVQMMARLGGYMSYDKNNAIGLDDGDANWADVSYWVYGKNENTKFPSPGTTGYSTIYTTYKTALLWEKSDYFKIKDITLAYNVNRNWLQKAHIANAKVYGSLKNFLTWSKVGNYDSERGGAISFPLRKQFVLGLNLSF